MSEPKPSASLGPLLLARKGRAKPALRSSLGKSRKSAAIADPDSMQDNECSDGAISPVLRLAKTSNSNARRAAFTLRLDDERHLKLKLASAIAGVSAQQIVTQALDHMMAEMPEIETLAAQVRRDGNKA